MFRAVMLPRGVSGQLYLHSMPGRYEGYQEAKDEIAGCGIGRVICLAPAEELRAKSAEYARDVEAGQLPWVHVNHPVTDYGAPGDRQAFWALAQDIADRLRQGEKLLIHCGAGIGRTGTLAVCVLLNLRMTPGHALKVVQAVGAGPETPAQKDVIDWVHHQLLKQER